MPSVEEIKIFYDGFITQLATENGRHRRIYQSLDTLPKGKVLDVGCGAGLTSKRLAEGGRDVVAIDLSPVAISYATDHNNHPRIKYVCAKIEDFKTEEKFDAICMVDVIEHLPHVFGILKLIKCSHENTVLYVNIPYCETISYIQVNYPETLQIIDNYEGIGDIISLFETEGFIPFKMELYWMKYVEYFFCTRARFNSLMDEAYGGLRHNG
jgi:SAM-dependent methyltransferase